MAQLTSSTVFGSFRITGNLDVGGRARFTNAIGDSAGSSGFSIKNTGGSNNFLIDVAGLTNYNYFTLAHGGTAKWEFGSTGTNDPALGANVFYFNPTVQSGGLGFSLALYRDRSSAFGSTLTVYGNIWTPGELVLDRPTGGKWALGSDGTADGFYLYDRVNSAYRMVVDKDTGSVVFGRNTPWNDGYNEFKLSLQNTTSVRVARFEGTTNASVWWGGGGTQQFALDSISGGGADFWMYSSSTWLKRFTIGNTNNGYGANLFTFRGYNGTTQSVPLVGYTDANGVGITDNEGSYRNLIYMQGSTRIGFYAWNGSASKRNFNVLPDGGFTFGLDADQAKVIFNATDASIDFIVL